MFCSSPYFLLLFVFVAVVVGDASANPPVSAENADTVEVYYLLSPLFYNKYGDFFGKYNAYHAGVGFVDRSSKKNYTIDFGANNFMGAVFPDILPGGDLRFDDGGKVAVEERINASYWQNFTYVGTIPRSYLTSVINVFVPAIYAAHPKYVLFSVFGTNGQVLFPSVTCQDFVWDLLSFLMSLGMPRPTVTLSHDFIGFRARGMREVDFGESRGEIVRYYETLTQIKNLTISEIIDRLESILGGEVYLHAGIRGGDAYYQLDLAMPPFVLAFRPEPLPRKVPFMPALVDLARDFLATGAPVTQRPADSKQTVLPTGQWRGKTLGEALAHLSAKML